MGAVSPRKERNDIFCVSASQVGRKSAGAMFFPYRRDPAERDGTPWRDGYKMRDGMPGIASFPASRTDEVQGGTKA